MRETESHGSQKKKRHWVGEFLSPSCEKKKKKKNPEILCFVLNWLKFMCWIINCGFFFFLTLNNKINNKNKRQNELIYIYIYIYINNVGTYFLIDYRALVQGGGLSGNDRLIIASAWFTNVSFTQSCWMRLLYGNEMLHPPTIYDTLFNQTIVIYDHSIVQLCSTLFWGIIKTQSWRT